MTKRCMTRQNIMLQLNLAYKIVKYLQLKYLTVDKTRCTSL